MTLNPLVRGLAYSIIQMAENTEQGIVTYFNDGLFANLLSLPHASNHQQSFCFFGAKDWVSTWIGYIFFLRAIIPTVLNSDTYLDSLSWRGITLSASLFNF